MLGQFLKRFMPRKRNGNPMRGRVSRVSVIRGGEVSVVLRFGLEELDRAKQLMPGVLLEVDEVQTASALLDPQWPRSP